MATATVCKTVTHRVNDAGSSPASGTYKQWKWLAIGQAWRQFDRATAYGCAIRSESFDADRCAAAWEQYVAVIRRYYTW